MEQLHEQDTLVSHNILNFLHAGFQGEYTYMKVMRELGSPEIGDEALARVKLNLDRILKWYHGLPKGDCLFSAKWTSPQTFEAKKAIEFLGDMRAIVERSSRTLFEIVGSEDWRGSKDKTRKAVANIARNAFSSLHYAQGILDLSKLTNNADATKAALALVQQADATIGRVLEWVAMVKQDGKISDAGTRNFLNEARHSAGTLAAQAHDIVYLLAPYNGGDAYIVKTFDPSVLQSWKDLGFSPVEAGYWRAYRISPQDAATWRSNGLLNAVLATIWSAEGFSPEDAGKWIGLGVSPEMADKWRSARYGVNEAAGYIKKGFATPDMLPKGD